MPKEMDSLMGNTYPGKIWQTFMEQAHEGLEWLDFLPYTQIPDASSGEMEAEDAATDEGNAQGETPAENGDTPQENVTDTPDTPQGSATDVPSSSQENGQGDIGYAGCHTGTAVRRSAAEYNRNVTGKCIRRIAGKCSAVIWGKCSAVIRGRMLRIRRRRQRPGHLKRIHLNIDR